MRHAVLSIIITGIWISVSEFLRNQLLFLSYWEDHFSDKGLVFSTEPVNGLVWGVWSIVFASVLYVLLQRFNAKETVTLGWVIGFFMMWLVVGNLGVLPFKLLLFAVPLSLLE